MLEYWGGREFWLLGKKDRKQTPVEQRLKIGIGSRKYSLIWLKDLISLFCLVYTSCNLKKHSELDNNGIEIYVSSLEY